MSVSNRANKHYEDAIVFRITLAKQGHVDAQYNLGLMYYNGLGFLKDIVVVYAWWNVAAAQGNEIAPIDRDNFEDDMKP